MGYMSALDLNAIWFILIGVLFMGYAMLDGFDLGVGALHLFTKSDEERRVMLNAIGPVWDGNEVWLVTGGGALFAAFPNVYATVFSGFYHGVRAAASGADLPRGGDRVPQQAADAAGGGRCGTSASAPAASCRAC